ncbi:DUF6903 family protein [Anaerococcus porci]|uniref:Uncharacterized protein n=1 Tax=Anaerococcus porci TaxID=2652269 RepID=A0A6N7VUL9_9FIRM|nr:hypothetical protein [Anaerococcus porci]MDY3005568.1 hypothetical protein [Anaerococcus porci]MSS77517.1 hypothetical protein [Anaerococcus porci]
MDYYKKKKMANLILGLIFIIAVILQFIGHATTGYKYLFIQIISLGLLLLDLYLYNRRFS